MRQTGGGEEGKSGMEARREGGRDCRTIAGEGGGGRGWEGREEEGQGGKAIRMRSFVAMDGRNGIHLVDTAAVPAHSDAPRDTAGRAEVEWTLFLMLCSDSTRMLPSLLSPFTAMCALFLSLPWAPTAPESKGQRCHPIAQAMWSRTPPRRRRQR